MLLIFTLPLHVAPPLRCIPWQGNGTDVNGTHLNGTSFQPSLNETDVAENATGIFGSSGDAVGREGGGGASDVPDRVEVAPFSKELEPEQLQGSEKEL